MLKTIIILLLGAVLIICAMKLKQNKFAVWVLLAYMFMIYAFCNSGNPDLEIYVWQYNDKIYGISFLFDLLMSVFGKMGLSFIVFKATCGIFIISILYLCAKSTTDYIALVLGLTVIFPFTSTISQIRNGLMMAVVMYAVVTFIQDDKQNIWKYIIKIIIAALIHPVALFYLIFLLSKINFTNKQKLIFLIILLGALFIEACIAFNLLYEIAKIFIHNEKYLVYFNYAKLVEDTTSEVLNWKGKLLPIVGHSLFYLVFRYLYKEFKKILSAKSESGLDSAVSNNLPYHFSIEQLDMVNTMLFSTLILLPFYALNPTYFRMFKNVSMLIYIVDAQCLSYSKVTGLRRIATSHRHWAVLAGAILATLMTAYSQGAFLTVYESFSIFR